MPRINPPLPVIALPIYQVQISGTIDSQVWVNSHIYVASTSTQTPTSEENIATTWGTACITSYRGLLNSNTGTVESVKVTCLSNLNRISFTAPITGATQDGTVGSASLPNMVAAVLSKYTGTKGQHGRGRTYFPGVPDTFITPATDENRLNATGLTAYALVTAALQSNTILDGANVMTLSIATRPKTNVAWTQAAPVLTLLMRTLLGTIRRRRIGVGK